MAEKIKRKLNRSQMIAGYFMILPAVSLFAVFYAYCIFKAIGYSFIKWDGIGEQIPVGFGNFIDIFRNMLFWKSFYNNSVYALGILVFGALPGLLLAYLLAIPGIKFRTMFRSIYFLPRIVTPVIYGVVWQWIYNPRNGLLLYILRFFHIGFENLSVLGNPNTAMMGIIITGGWTYFGFCMVIFLAAFQGIDRSMEESAILDGASKFRIFRSIIIPAIRPVIDAVIIYTIIDSFKVFDLVLIMTNGGPDDATSILTYFIYKQAFRMNQYGYGSAVSVVLAVVMLAFAIIYQKKLGKEEAD
jgi:raffinose/stachyose/melibiose transport system permease protein